MGTQYLCPTNTYVLRFYNLLSQIETFWFVYESSSHGFTDIFEELNAITDLFWYPQRDRFVS